MRRNLLLLTFFLAVAAIKVYGQGNTPAGEIFFGGSRIWESDSYGRYQDNGLSLAATTNLNRYLGLETDLGLITRSTPAPPAFADRFRFLAGPHFESNADKHVSPFAHFLVGVTHGSQDCDFLNPPPGCDTGDWIAGRPAFTMDLGAGLDIKVLGPFWVRPLQADFFHEYFPGSTENKLQLSFGLTFRFGTRGKSRKRTLGCFAGSPTTIAGR